MSLRLGDLVQKAKQSLERAGIETASHEARILTGQAAQIGSDHVSLCLDDVVDEAADRRLDDYLAARTRRVPLAHITGRRAFYDHEFHVTPDVLDPRADTETLVELALNEPFSHVLDLGTGTGCILISLLAARPGAAGIGTDVSDKALDVALGNARDLGVADRCMFLHSDWFSNVEGQFDLIVSNPPYISQSEMAAAPPELAHEPRMALTDDADGLTAYRAIIPGAGAHLQPRGRLAVEIGWRQRQAVVALFETAGFDDVSVYPDLEGRDRVVAGCWPGN